MRGRDHLKEMSKPLVLTLVVLLASLAGGMLPGDASSASAQNPRTGLIAFVSRQPLHEVGITNIENDQIFVIAVNGRGRRMLTLNPRADNYGPQWSPDGKRMLFWRTHGRQSLGLLGPDLYVVNSDGSGQRMLLVDRDDTPKDDLEGADWSPDGKRIAFNRHSEIYVMNADGSSRRRLTHRGDVFARGVGWSPDGERIAFARWELNPVLYAVNADGGGLRLLANGGEEDFQWSPTGKALLFTTRRQPTSLDDPYSPQEIHVISVGSRGRGRNLSNGADDYSPAWSPDGRRIVFARHQFGEPSRIWVLNPNGSGLHTLGVGEEPSWSPDGRRLVFVAGREIYIMNADGTRRHRLTRDPFRDHGPTWQPRPHK